MRPHLGIKYITKQDESGGSLISDPAAEPPEMGATRVDTNIEKA